MGINRRSGVGLHRALVDAILDDLVLNDPACQRDDEWIEDARGRWYQLALLHPAVDDNTAADLIAELSQQIVSVIAQRDGWKGSAEEWKALFESTEVRLGGQVSRLTTELADSEKKYYDMRRNLEVLQNRVRAAGVKL